MRGGIISNDELSIKNKMLKEFESQINTIFDKYFNHVISFEECIHNINRVYGFWSVSRIDIKNEGTSSNKISCLNEENININYPDWFTDKQGKGCVIESDKQLNNLQIECQNNGSLKINLRGRDFRDINSERIPVYIVFTKLLLNNKIILDEEKIVWHDAPFNYSIECNDKELIELTVNFKTIYDYYPDLRNILKNVSEESNLSIIYNSISKYIKSQKTQLNKNINFHDSRNVTYNQLLEKLSDAVKKLSEENKKLSKELKDYKQENQRVLNSFNTLFNSLFIHHNVEPKKIVKYSHELNLQLLDFVDNICKKYNLQWWLHAGSLLGAVRHEGFIPWDDDCDINMLREDYEKFLSIVQNEIDNHNLTETLLIKNKTITNTGVYLPFMKLEYRINGKLYSFIDIFPSDFTPKALDNLEEVFDKEYKNVRNRLKKGEKREIVLNDAFKKLNVTKEKTDTIISGVEDSNLLISEYDSVFPLIRLRFEDRMYPVPNDYEKNMINMYGKNYRKIPNIIYDHGFYNLLLSHENVFENFEKSLNIMDKVNKNF